jgi:hypothetical protein
MARLFLGDSASHLGLDLTFGGFLRFGALFLSMATV